MKLPMDPRRLAACAFLGILLIAPLTWAQRDCCEGEAWLKWSKEHRNDYVKAYIRGYYGGYFQACQESTRRSPSTSSAEGESPVDECLSRKLDFTRGIELSTEITQFYTRYPKNRILLVNEVLEELGKGKSIEDIHKHPPFPAHDSSKAAGSHVTHSQ